MSAATLAVLPVLSARISTIHPPQKNMIVITTPTGAIGRRIVEHVLGSGEPVRVIARDPDALAAHIRERVEIVQGSHGDLNVVTRAFAGADAVFWLVPPNPRAESLEAAYLDFTRPACQALTSQGVQRVVAVSALGRGTAVAKNSGLIKICLEMEDLISSTGVNLRALTMPSFMENILQQVDPMKSKGMFFSPISGDRKLPTCATRDIAAVASKLLLDPTWTGRDHVAVLGPEDLSFNDIAQIISGVLGKVVRYQQIPLDAFKARLLESGMSEAFAQGYADMMAAKDQGLDNAEPRTPQSTTPTSFRQWCEEELKLAVLS